MIETVIVVVILSLIFFFLVQIGYLYICRMVADHAAFVMGRSHVVGFDRPIVERAMEVGTIPLSGHLTKPEAMTGMSPSDLGDVEPILIQDFIQTDEYTIWYQHWDRIHADLPSGEHNRVERFRVNVFDYPTEVPMSGAYMNRKSVNFLGEAHLHNHAAYYLE
jgi:hypothetical protein